MRMMNPVHPGVILRASLGDMDVTDAAKRLKISRTALSRILNGHAGLSADMALRLEKFFGNPSEFWMDLQKQWELAQARKEDAPVINSIRPLHQAVRA